MGYFQFATIEHRWVIYIYISRHFRHAGIIAEHVPPPKWGQASITNCMF